MCEKLMYYPEIFENNFIEYFKDLSKDKVINVRIALAKAMYNH